MNARTSLAMLTVLLVLVVADAADAQVDARMFRHPAVSHADRLRLRRRHLAGAESRRHRHAAQLAARRGDVPALFARRHQARLQRRLRRQHRRLRRAGRRRGAGAAHASPDGRPRRRLASRRQARAVRVGRESGRQRYNQFYLVSVNGGLPEKLPVPYGEFGAFSPDARGSSTCRCRRTSATGSATAAAGRRTCCSST